MTYRVYQNLQLPSSNPLKVMADRVLGVIFGAALGDCIGLYTGEKTLS
jgi:hypothetical protein